MTLGTQLLLGWLEVKLSLLLGFEHITVIFVGSFCGHDHELVKGKERSKQK